MNKGLCKYEMLTETDREVLKRTGYAASCGWGQHPLLVIIDAQKKFVGTDSPILESMEEYPISIGENAVKAVDNIAKLLEVFRKHGLPVIYTTSGVPKKESRFNTFIKKRTPHELVKKLPDDLDEFPEQITPLPEEVVIHKHFASALFATHMASYLNVYRPDTIVTAGFVTSGCVRAFVVDAASYNYNVILAGDACADRFEFCHEATLVDLDIKYADVCSTEEIISHIGGM